MAGPADHAKRKRAVIVMAGRSLRYHRNFEFCETPGIAAFRKPSGQRENNRFDTTETGRKEVRIEEQLHFDSLLFRLSRTAASTAPTQQSRNSSLVQDFIWRPTPSFSCCNLCGSARTLFKIPASAWMSPQG